MGRLFVFHTIYTTLSWGAGPLPYQCYCGALASGPRLSQDLAKDLASLAREIHDVAGEAEPQSSAAEAQVPASNVTAHEEVREQHTGSQAHARHPGRETLKTMDRRGLLECNHIKNLADTFIQSDLQ